MTETGMSLGTPHYMSPEQAMGEREITARSDIYALGCVLYEMLTGEPPFEGATAQAIVARVLTESPRSLRPQRKSVPPHVEAAVLTALEKLPADRFESARAFAEALGDPAYAGSPGSGTRVIASRAGAGSGTRSGGGSCWRPPPCWRPPSRGWRRGGRSGTSAAPTSRRSCCATAWPCRTVLALTDALGTPISYAPDGSVFAYSSRVGLMLRYADRLDVVPVAGGRRGSRSVLLPGRAVARLPERRRRWSRFRSRAARRSPSAIRAPASASAGAPTTPSATIRRRPTTGARAC